LNFEFSSNPSSIVAAPNIYDYDFQSNMWSTHCLLCVRIHLDQAAHAVS
jgi:hypothetical protein